MCDHLEFEASVGVNRLMQTDGGPVTHFMADIAVWCKECRTKFVFHGAPIGLSPYAPSVNLAGDELRVPLMPPGQELPRGLAGFSIKLPEVAS